MDGSATISTVQPNGARTAHLYVERTCRINTYGDSFTQCHQVSDGETWQEYLAGHLGEPIRNFGMGGYGVYQAYRRMLREEKGPTAAPSTSSSTSGATTTSAACCAAATPSSTVGGISQGGQAFHNNFWANLEMDLQTGRSSKGKTCCPPASRSIR